MSVSTYSTNRALAEFSTIRKCVQLAVLIFAVWVFCSLCSQIAQTAIMRSIAMESRNAK